MNRLNRNHGMVSAQVLLISLAAFLIISSVTALSMQRLREARRAADATSALQIAEGGAEYTIARLNLSSTYTGTSGAVSLGSGAFSTTVQNVGTRYTVVSVGTLPNGTSRSIVIKLGLTSQHFPLAAVVSNGSVTFSGGSHSAMSGTDTQQAGIYANNNVTVSGGSIDGPVCAGNTASMSGGATATQVVQHAPQTQFPSASELATTEQSYITQAQAGGTVSAASVSTDGTINSPVYISGNVSLSGKTLNIIGNGVVYISGTLTVSSSDGRVNNSALLVVHDNITFSGGSKYFATGDLSTGGLVGFGTSGNNAIVISGGGLAQPLGMIYATQGGITCSGSSNVYGMLLAGYTGSKSCTVSGGGSIVVPSDMAGNQLLGTAWSWLEK